MVDLQGKLRKPKMIAYANVMVAHRALFHGKPSSWVVNFFNRVTDKPTDPKLIK